MQRLSIRLSFIRFRPCMIDSLLTVLYKWAAIIIKGIILIYQWSIHSLKIVELAFMMTSSIEHRTTKSYCNLSQKSIIKWTKYIYLHLISRLIDNRSRIMGKIICEFSKNWWQFRKKRQDISLMVLIMNKATKRHSKAIINNDKKA